MNNYFFIVADRGKLKAYRAEKAPAGRSPHVELVETISLVEAHLSPTEIFTDEAGSFPTQTGAGSRQTIQGNSIAERHYEIEEDRRSAKQLAKHIEDILRREKPDGWAFAAPADIQEMILAELEPGFVGQLSERLARDLVNIPANEVLDHFSSVRAVPMT